MQTLEDTVKVAESVTSEVVEEDVSNDEEVTELKKMLLVKKNIHEKHVLLFVVPKRHNEC